MTRVFSLLVLGVVTTRPADAQACAHAKQVTDTSHVVKLLKQTFQRDSAAAIRASHALVSLDSTAFPALLAVMCRDAGSANSPEDFGLPDRAGGLLAQLGRPGVRALVRALGDSDSTLALNATGVLAISGVAGLDATPELLPLLSDRRASVRARAAQLVRLGGSTREAAIAAMARALRDSDPDVREAAASHLATQGPDGRPLVPDLTKALRDSASGVRHAATLALGQTQTKDSAAVATLARALRADPDTAVRGAAAIALGELGVGGSPAEPALIAGLKDSNEQVRSQVAMALGLLGARGAVVGRDAILEALSAALTDFDSRVRASAADALRRIGVPAAQQHVLGLENRDPRVRITAVRSLGEQPPTPEAIHALSELLWDPVPDVRAEAVAALGGFGPVVEERMHALQSGSDELVKSGATQVLQYLREVNRLPLADACFDLHLASWKPPLGIGEDTIYSTPPRTVRFSRVKRIGFGSSGDQLSFRVLPANGAKFSVHGPGFWSPVQGEDSVSIVWTTGFSGLEMSLRVAGDTLRGLAQTFWDFSRERQTSQVTGVRVTCR